MSDMLIVATKLRKFIKDKSGMNTSGAVLDVLNKLIQDECEKAILKAQADKRKTVMARDFGVEGVVEKD